MYLFMCMIWKTIPMAHDTYLEKCLISNCDSTLWLSLEIRI